MIVVGEIEVPKKLGSRQEELLRELAELEGEGGILPRKDGFWSKVKDLLGN